MKLLLFIQIHFYRLLSFFIPKKKAKIENSVLYLAAFFPENAGYHWRVKLWAELLEKENYKVDVLHALNEKEFYEYSKNSALFMFRFLNIRFWQILKARKFKTVIVRREILLFNEYGNMFLEKMLRRFCSNLILDFDDDLSASKKQPKKINSLYAKLLLENGNSFRESLKYYDKFIVGSQYLKEYVITHSNIKEKNIEIIPTCVDYDKYPAKIYKFDKKHIFTLGWIGGNHNYHLLQEIIPVLNKLASDYKFKLLVIGGKKFEAQTNFEIDFRRWSLETEIEDLMDIDVGLMPLKNNETSKGKGGFKLLQYMGLGIVGVAFNLTINKEIVTNYENSFLYSDNEELFLILSQILSNKFNLKNIGKKAKENIEKNYTFTANKVKYIDFIKNEDL